MSATTLPRVLLNGHGAEALAAFKARQSAKGQKGGKGNTREAQAAKGAIGGHVGMLSRWGDNESKQASARIMAAKGMTQRAIADELGVSQKTVSNWLRFE